MRAMNRFPPAENGPQYELVALARAMDDLAPGEEAAPRADVFTPLIFAGCGLLALIMFFGWLLVS